MDTGASEATIVELARMLEMRGNSDHRTVLFLGARTGGLFRSQKLYELSLHLGYQSFSELSRIEQFGACYKAIQQKHYGETEQDIIFAESLGELGKLGFTKTDVCVAELAQKKLFDVVISTNIDDFLERAFEHVQMRQPDDFQIRSPKRPSFTWMPKPCKLIKAFGDRTARDYRMIGQDMYLDSDKELKKELEAYLERDILMIGFDHIWDEEIHDIYPLSGKSFWYVNEQFPPDESSRISKALRNRQGSRYIVGTPSPGGYDYFVQELHNCIMGRGPLSPELVQDMFNQINEIRELTLQLRRDITNLPTALHELLKPKRKASTKKT